MIIKLPIHSIEIEITPTSSSITSDLHVDRQLGDLEPYEDTYQAAVDTLESMILACATEGIDVTSEAFLKAIQTTLDAVINHID